MPTVIHVEAFEEFQLRIWFKDGLIVDRDLESHLWGPVFDQIRSDSGYFRQVYVDPLSQTLTWPNGVDLDPDSLYYGDQEPPWWTEYKKERAKKKARLRRQRTRRNSVNGRGGAVKPKPRKKTMTKTQTRKTAQTKKK